MGIHSIRLPDVGEGVAEAELVEWSVKVGDTVLEDEIVGAVMTDKAAVEIPTSVAGKVTWLGGEIGDVIAVGAELLRLEVEGEGNTDGDSAPAVVATEAPVKEAAVDDSIAEVALPVPEKVKANVPEKVAASAVAKPIANNSAANSNGSKPLAAPSVRKRARDLGIDLRSVSGSGPAGRVVHEDLENHTEASSIGGGRLPNAAVDEIKVVGLRRLIASKMSQAKRQIPHITIVEEIDVTSLEQTRAELNASYESERGKLTVLPFVMKAVVEAVRLQPVINSLYDDENEVIRQYGGVHIGVATQTDNGLMVPVVKHSEVRSLWDSAAEVARLATACREGTADREELSGSTITITSLGPLGAIATTPIINHPEVAIVGINKMVIRPFWDGQQVMVQKLKELLEKPAMLLVEA